MGRRRDRGARSRVSGPMMSNQSHRAVDSKFSKSTFMPNILLVSSVDGKRLLLLATPSKIARNALRPTWAAAIHGRGLSIRIGRGEEVIPSRWTFYAIQRESSGLHRRSSVPTKPPILREPVRQGVLVFGSERSEPGLACARSLREQEGRTKSPAGLSGVD